MPFVRTPNLVWSATYVIGCAMSVAVGLQLHHYLEDRERNALQADFYKAVHILKEKTYSYHYGLQGMAGVYQALGWNPSPQQVRDYATMRDNFKNFPGALGFGFIRYVPASKLNEFVESRRRFDPRFRVASLQSGVEAEPQNHFVIEVVEPRASNAAAIGLDVGSEAHRRAAAERSARLGKAVLTASVQLVQVNAVESGFLYFQPVYDLPFTPETEEARLRHLVGWAYAPIRLTPLIDHMRELSNPALRFYVSDVNEAGDNLIYLDRDFLRQRNVVQFGVDLDIGERRWRVEAQVEGARGLVLARWVSLAWGGCLWLAFSLFFLFVRKQLIEKQERERYLASMESWQNAILNSSQFSMISTTPEGIISTYNQAAERMLGYQAHELIGVSTPIIIHDIDEVITHAAELSRQLQQNVAPSFDTFVLYARTFGSETREWTYIRKDGTRFPVRLTVTVLRDREGVIIGYLGIAEDITGERKLRETIEQQRAQMIQSTKMSALGEMASGISHEINNPLAIISGSASILGHELESPVIDRGFMRERIQRIEETAQRIGDIVAGLRAFARESNQDKPSRVALEKVVRDTLSFCTERFRNHAVELRIEVPQNLAIECRPSQISQVLLNLLNNSFDALSEQDERWVRVRGYEKEDRICLSVIDSGPGIPRGIVDKMMEPFFTTKEVGKGTGLGLSIAMGLMKSHGGQLRYEMNDSHTHFVMEFPRPRVL